MTGPGRRAYNQARALQAARRRYWLGRVEAVSTGGVVLPFRGGRVTPRHKRRPPNWSPAAFMTPLLEVGSRMSIDDRASTDAYDSLEKQRQAELATLHDLLSTAEDRLSGPPLEFTQMDLREVKAIVEAASALIRHWVS